VKLTPLDIRKQEFKRTMRGLDPDEVEAFLSMVADELEMIIRERNQLNDELIKLRTQLKDYQQVEHTLRETLVKAQNTVEESRANSRREAELILHEAELKAEEIVKDAKDELNNLKNEIALLRVQKDSFAKRLRHLLESQIELLEVLNIDDTNFEDQHQRLRGRMPRPIKPTREEAAPAPSPASGSGPGHEPVSRQEEEPLRGPSAFDLSRDFREQRTDQRPPNDRDEDDEQLSDQIII